MNSIVLNSKSVTININTNEPEQVYTHKMREEINALTVDLNSDRGQLGFSRSYGEKWKNLISRSRILVREIGM